MTTVSAIIAGVTTVAVIAAASVLTWHGSITGEAAVTLFASVLAGGGAAVISQTSHKAGARAASSSTDS
jgi:hypothetical protein